MSLERREARIQLEEVDGRKCPAIAIGESSYICGIEISSRADFIGGTHIHNVQVGKHSSIASGVEIIVDMDHDYHMVVQGCLYNIGNPVPKYIKRKSQVIIMNDCWIGKNVTILGDVVIGNGAVVATGAVVSKDIPPYAIVAGNPARIIKYRFDKETIQALQLIQWWHWPQKMKLENKELLFQKPDLLVQKYLLNAEKEWNSVEKIDLKKIPKPDLNENLYYYYVPDFEQISPTYEYVICSFIEKYQNTNRELILYLKSDKNIEQKLEILDQIFLKYKDKNAYINLYIGGEVVDERAILKQVDFYITNRDIDNIKRMEYAMYYGVNVLSGVGVPIFE